MKIKRKHKTWRGEEQRTDEDIVEGYLVGWVHSDGQLERLEQEVANMRRLIAELLVALHGKDVVDLCEDKE